MFSKERSAKIYGVSLCLVYMVLAGLALHGLWPRFGMYASLPILGGLGIGFYFVGKWVFIDRPAELNRKYPTGSAELRRQRKAFFDSLASRGRR